MGRATYRPGIADAARTAFKQLSNRLGKQQKNSSGFLPQVASNVRWTDRDNPRDAARSRFKVVFLLTGNASPESGRVNTKQLLNSFCADSELEVLMSTKAV